MLLATCYSTVILLYEVIRAGSARRWVSVLCLLEKFTYCVNNDDWIKKFMHNINKERNASSTSLVSLKRVANTTTTRTHDNGTQHFMYYEFPLGSHGVPIPIAIFGQAEGGSFHRGVAVKVAEFIKSRLHLSLDL
jgi:hypothetical protein